MRIIQISDTHLSPGKSHFADNWPPLAVWIAAERPDLVIHTGDVTVDGADVEEDMGRSWKKRRAVESPGLSTARCFSTLRTKAILDIGR